MAVQYAHAKKGYIFKPTYFGKQVKAIANKYKNLDKNNIYYTCVPRTWLTNNYVEEVKEGE